MNDLLLTTVEVSQVLGLNYFRFRSVCRRMKNLPKPVVSRGGRDQPAKYSALQIVEYGKKFDAKREMLDAFNEYNAEWTKAKTRPVQPGENPVIDDTLAIRFIMGKFDRPGMRGQYTKRRIRAKMNHPETYRIRVGNLDFWRDEP